MTAVSEDASADLKRKIAELERRLEAALLERDAAIDRQTASALVNFRLQNELRAAAEHRSAGSEILRMIAATAGEAEQALQRIAEATQHFFNAASVTIRVADGDEWVQTVRVGSGSQLTGAQPAAQLAARGANLPATVYQDNRQIHIPDLDNIDPSMAHWPAAAARAAGIRTICGSPLRCNGKAIGAMLVYRDRLAAFTDDELALQQSFADQAVIAIENARLFNQTRQALDRQDASAEILRTIAAAPTDAEQSLRQIAETTARLFRASSVTLRIVKDGTWGQTIAVGPGSERIAASIAPSDLKIGGKNFPGTIVAENRQIHLPDIFNVEPAYADFPGLVHARAAGTKTMAGTPLRREGKAIGSLIVHRDRLEPFTPEELALQQSFADQAVIAIENARLFNQTQEALERQTATADILKVIASSPSDVQPVFDAIAERSNRLMDGHSTAVYRFVDGMVELVSFTSINPEADAALQAVFPRPLSQWPMFELVSKGNTEQLQDIESAESEAQFAATTAMVRDVARARGFRSALLTPLPGDEGPIGLISVTRREPSAFAPQHVQLLQTFADQAVIAIENARLFNETQAALARQTATSDILRVISGSPTDVQPVFDAIVETAVRLIGCDRAFIQLCDGNSFWTVAWCGPEGHLPILNPSPIPIDPAANFPSRAIVERTTLHLPDWSVLELPEFERAIQDRLGINSALYMPLVRDGECIGLLALAGKSANSFGAADIALAESFRDQALIAIENTRLFNETKEALERQTATADILRVINSSGGNLAPVYDIVLEKAHYLCGAPCGSLQLYQADRVVAVATRGMTPEFDEFLRAGFPITEGLRQRLFASRPTQHVDLAELLRGQPHEVALRASVELGGIKTTATVPLAKDGVTFGRIVAARQVIQPFSDKQVALLQSFADQAVIAIENARLFNETQEALERQTATSDILKVIASSPSDVQPVFDAIATSANRLIGGFSTAVHRIVDDIVHLASFTPVSAESDAALQAVFPVHRSEMAAVALVENGETAQIADSETADMHTRQLSRARGWRSVTFVPLMSQGALIGFIACTRRETGLIADHHVQLLRTFADQAVIAIENTRLFNEVQARTRDLEESLQQQTATADVLKVISRSTFDLQTVLETLIKSAVELSGANRGSIFLREGDVFPLKAASSTTPEFLQYWAANPPRAGRGSATERVIASGKVELIEDVLADPEMQMTTSSLVRIRAALGVPMLRDNKVEGVLVLTRPEPGPFSKSQIDLVQTFADQAVIAVENVRLFEEAQARTRELAASLEELRTAQDRLVQTEKLASLGQLTAGIAHEIKNPLNFVNNFAALSSELTDELKDALKPAVLDETIRAEVEELTGLLKDNLGKVVQHGKRADSIVKNMLLHSREGSGEHRPADINALVEESLNLAYHGARAEKPQFNVTLQRDFDPKAGVIEVFPQEITRVLLNLISNGFYAVAKRKAEAADGSFEPVVSATTKGRADQVEIRIRDNGTGIPPEVKERMFNPFFTTKPAGEGTGLGLSMSHDIIVKQHGGTIDVDTLPGAFTEFTILLPRTSNLSSKTRG